MGEGKRREERMTPYERQMQDLAFNLANRGQLIESGWIGMRKVLLPADAPEQSVAAMRKAYMSGALHTWTSMMAVLESGDTPTSGDMARIAKIKTELELFAAEIGRDLMPVKGTA